MMGVLYVVTFGIFGIGWLSDLFLSAKYVAEKNEKKSAIRRDSLMVEEYVRQTSRVECFPKFEDEDFDWFLLTESITFFIFYIYLIYFSFIYINVFYQNTKE